MSNLVVDSWDEINSRDFGDGPERLRVFPGLRSELGMSNCLSLLLGVLSLGPERKRILLTKVHSLESA